MFVVKYHAKGHRTKYLGDKKEVVNKRCAIAFGEGLRGQFEQVVRALHFGRYKGI